MLKRIRSTLAWLMVLALMLGCIPSPSMEAAVKPRFNTVKKTITIGETETLKVENRIAGSKYIWSTSNKKIAAVTNRGEVTGAKKGKATISCKVTAGKREYSLTCAVSVTTDAVVSTQASLKKALKNDKITKVTIKTLNEGKFSIPAGDYGEKTLVVNAPKSDVTNRGVFNDVTIQAVKANTWTERAIGNKITVTAPVANLVVGKGAGIANLKLAKKDAQISLKVNGSVDTISVLESADIILTSSAEAAGDDVGVVDSVEIPGSHVNFIVNKNSTVNYVTVRADKVVISGNGTVKNVNVTEDAKEGVEVLTVPTKVTVNAKAGAVKIKYGIIQPGRTVTTSNASSGSGFSEQDMVPAIDGDMPVYIKDIFGLDTTTDDNDGDGLKDAFEFSYLMTSLLLVDTDENGVSDADEDFDGDGLTNIQEQELHIRPDMIDTDGDGLEDGDEVNIYNTSPLKADTDEDGLIDSEEIKLGLNPDNPSTDGITPDSERKFEQTANDSVKDEELLDSTNWLVPTISGNVTGDITKNVFLEKSDDSIYDGNHAVLSDVIHVSSAYEIPLTLSFAYNQEYSGNIINLTIVSFGENGLELIDTALDETGKTVSGEITGDGTYFVIDLDEFLKGIGIDVFANIEEVVENEPIIPEFGMEFYSFSGLSTTRSLAVLSEPAASSAAEKVDIVFVLDTTSSMRDDISNVGNNINTFVQSLTADYNVDANFALITYKDILQLNNSTQIHKNKKSNWFTNADADEFQAEVIRTVFSVYPPVSLFALNDDGYDDGDGFEETPLDGLGMAKELNWRLNSAKFVVLLTDEWSSQYNTYGYSNINEIADAFATDNICVSVVTETGLENDYRDLWEATNGLTGSIFGEFVDMLFGLVNKADDIINADGEWVFLDDLQVVKLGCTLSNASANDTDGDGLTDEQELGTSINKDMMPYIGFLLNRYDIPVGNYTGMTTLAAWKYSSNPVKADSDNDGMLDGKATIVNNKVVIPKDPHPRGTHPMAKIWKQQVKQAENKMISQNYQTNVTDNLDDFLSDTFRKAGLAQNVMVKAINRPAKVVIKEIMVNVSLSNRGKLLERSPEASSDLAKIKEILNHITDNKTAAKMVAGIGAFVLNFHLDDQGTAYHAKPVTWQKDFGYNDFYDDIFYLGSDMQVGQLFFDYGNKMHVIWAWRGDYWNLGTGAEVGVYEYDRSVNSTDHYNALDFNLPMTLNLYLRGSAKSYFNWSPTEKQWWITGFNYRYRNPNAGELVLLGSIDFSQYPEMYRQVKTCDKNKWNNELRGSRKLSDYVIFDDDSKMLWIMWYSHNGGR